MKSRSWIHIRPVYPRLGKLIRRLAGPAFSGLSIAVLVLPSAAAERIVFSYGYLERFISVDALETFAQEGRIDDQLAPYIGEASPEELEAMRAVLLSQAELSPVTLSQFLYSSLGEVLLQYAGELIQTDSRLNGFSALRAAVVLAAGDSDGLTILNVLRHFPTRTVRINGVRALQVVSAFTQLLQQTDQMVALIEQQAGREVAAATPVDFAQLPDLQQPGSLSWQTETLQLYDDRRDRAFEADLYSPHLQVDAPVPVIVISHGLGSDRMSFSDLAQHLASHGFAVAVLEHPGSNNEQMQSLLKGTVSEMVEPSEFIDRPQDISFLLDELHRRNQTRSSQPDQFDLQQVGVVGHSLGGYAALALVGAELDFERLEFACTFEGGLNLVNFSLPLQCIALEGEHDAYPPLRDERVKAVFAMNPTISGVFSPSGLGQVQVPIMLVAGSHDPVAPALLEQIRPFSWLTGLDNYLVLIQGGTHIYSVADTSIDGALSLPAELAGPDPALARQYLKASSLAFMKTYVADQDDYQVYLSSAYTQAISQPPLKLELVSTLPLADNY
ncbi:MAG: alpha/beta hydrolase [Cyanobacteria bacterium P01_A01_bin.123]